MKLRGRLLVGSLVVSLGASVLVGWLIARAHDTAGSELVVGGSTTAFQPPTLNTNAKVAGHRLPDATVRTLAGTAVDTASLVGTPLVINVWGSTCGPCKAELPDFAAVHRELGDRVRFVGIDYLGASESEERFARDRGVGYELLYDGDGTFVTAAGIAAFPVTLFVAADGTIVRQTGQLDAVSLRQYIEEVLS